MKTANIRKIIKAQKAFTLVELLVVIAVLAVLAAAVLVAINPVEQINRGKDASRLSTVSQVGHALSQYAVNNSSSTNVYPQATAAWMTALTPNEIQSLVSVPQAANGCSFNQVGNGICYNSATSPAGAIVWTVLESNSENVKAGNGAVCGSGKVPAAIWDSTLGKVGVACIAGGANSLTPGTITLNQP